MMEGWQACFFVLIVDLALGRDIPVSNRTYLIKPIDSCPIEGYFFNREAINQNVIRSGPCYLCFCRNNGTAVCWERDNKRCDVERYHHHRVGRQSRIRRSPISLKDIFFQDASKNFIKKKLPQECNPAGESFSDGCPPEDWCIGCTVCDCASNGHWDCHVLSFCDGKEKKKKLKGMSKRRGVTSPIAKKIGNKTVIRKRSSNEKHTPSEKPKTVVKKPAQVPKNKPQYKTKKKQKQTPKKQVMRPPPKKSSKMRPQPKKPVPKKARLYVPKSNVSKIKVIRKDIATHKNLNLPRANDKRKVTKINSNNNNDTVKLGEKIVKQVMTAVHRLLMKEIGKINATARKQRSINLGRDCSHTKNWDKKTYNVKSKAAAKIKNKYNKRQNLARVNWRGIKGRFKREIEDYSNLDHRNITVITLSPDTRAVIPLEAGKSEDSTMINSSVYIKQDPSTATTSKENDYYKYLTNYNGYVNLSSVINETTTMIPVKNEDQHTFLNFVVPIETTSRINQNFKDEMTTEKKNLSSQLQRNEIEQKYHAIQKQNNTHTTKYYSSMPSSYSRNRFINKNKTDVTGLSIILQNLLKELKSNETIRMKPKPKISIMKYVRRFFRKIFSKKKTGSRKNYGIGPKEDHTLQTLCENIGPCKISKSNKFILKYKLTRLNDETKTILRSIGIIKGLLHLLDLPGTDVKNNVKSLHSFHNDVRKLSAVLRDIYRMEDKNLSLTDTQITQINYIKNNTRTFIESVKKFADILNEIIALVRPKNIGYNSTPGPPGTNKTNSEMSFDKIKKMLFKYNLIQNTFMRRMYELINVVEKKSTTATTTEKNTQMCDAKKNSTYHSRDKVIEKYSKNIIVNLRRLKNLAQILSSKRKRRNARGRDDALDYLLTLMEYLIKQNHPINSFPANDGIDLLIDAIRNAPDIKPHKRTFLKVDAPTPNTKLSSKINLSDRLPDDSNVDSNRISKEVSQHNKNEYLLSKEEILINKEHDLINKEENLINRENLILTKEKNQINQDETLTNKEHNILGRDNNQPERTTEIFDGSISKDFHKFIDNKAILVDNIYHTITDNNIQKKYSEAEKDKIGFEKLENSIDESKKFEVFSNDVDDDVIGDVAGSPSLVSNSTGDSNLSADEQTTDTSIMPNTTVNTIISSTESSSERQDALARIKKTKLDWIDETFDELGELNTPKPTPTITTDQNTVSTSVRNAENISGISAEAVNAIGKTKKATKNSGKNDVMYQKQLAFLASLDYAATEKTDFEESDSGDVS